MLLGFWRSKNWRGRRKGLELDDLLGPCQSKPSYDSKFLFFLLSSRNVLPTIHYLGLWDCKDDGSNLYMEQSPSSRFHFSLLVDRLLSNTHSYPHILRSLPLLSCSQCRGHPALTLSILPILVASHWVHAVTGGAVGGRTVGLRGREAVHGFDGVTPLAAAGRDGVGGVQATVKGRDGEVSLGLRRNPAGVAQDAHHLGKHRRQCVIRGRRETVYQDGE